MLARLCGAGMLLAIGAIASADTLDINVSSDAAQAAYSWPLGGQKLTGAELALGLLYEDDTDSTVGYFGIEMHGEAGSDSPGLNASLGARIIGLSTDTDDVLAVALGVGVQYAPPSLERLKLGASIYHAPDITTFNDGESFSHLDARIGYEVLPQASLFAGYRKVEADSTLGPSIDVSEGGYLGIIMTWF